MERECPTLRSSTNHLGRTSIFYKNVKMHFWKEEVDYLGHIISKEGAKVDPSKFKAITEWFQPDDISKL